MYVRRMDDIAPPPSLPLGRPPGSEDARSSLVQSINWQRFTRVHEYATAISRKAISERISSFLIRFVFCLARLAVFGILCRKVAKGAIADKDQQRRLC